MDYLSQILKCKTKDDIYRLAKLDLETSAAKERWIEMQTKSKDEFHAFVKQLQDSQKQNPPDPVLIREVSLALKEAVANGFIRFTTPGYVAFGRDITNKQIECFHFEPSDVSICICTEQDNAPAPDIIEMVSPRWLQSRNKRRAVLAHGIFAAVARNDPPSLQFVLDQQGADPNDAVDTMLDSALCRACSHWFNKCVELLVQHGADVNQAGNAFRTPLYYATEHDNSKAAMYLLEHGADPNRAGDELAAMRFTPLHFAAGHGDLPLIRLLASKGADVNASATDGNGTPIHYAGRSGDYLDRALYNQVVAELMRLGGRDSKWCSAGSRATATSITHAWSSFGFSGYGYRQA